MVVSPMLIKVAAALLTSEKGRKGVGFLLVTIFAPVILIAAKPFGYVGVCSADAAAWLTTGILLIVTYMIWKHRVKNS